MMQVIHKFRVPVIGEPFELDDVDCIVDFQTKSHGSGFSYYVWALVNLEPHIVRKKTFLVVATGQSFEHEWKHVQTLHVDGYVWHLLQDRDIVQNLADRIFPTS